MDEPILQDSTLPSSQSFPPAATERGTHSAHPATGATIDPEAARRFQGYETLVHEVCSLATQEAQARELALHHIDVRPAWSHEYDERTGIVVDAEVKATTDEQFSYWDAVGERLIRLEDALPPEERSFLVKEISFVVSQI